MPFVALLPTVRTRSHRSPVTARPAGRWRLGYAEKRDRKFERAALEYLRVSTDEANPSRMRERGGGLARRSRFDDARAMELPASGTTSPRRPSNPAMPLESWLRGVSSVGRAPALQAGGRRFEPGTLHRRERLEQAVSPKSGRFRIAPSRPYFLFGSDLVRSDAIQRGVDGVSDVVEAARMVELVRVDIERDAGRAWPSCREARTASTPAR
jgi:hypothetical protein